MQIQKEATKRYKGELIMARPLPVTGTGNKVQIPFPQTLCRGKELDYCDKSGAGVENLTQYEKEALENFRQGRGTYQAGPSAELSQHQRACLELYTKLIREQLEQKLGR